MKPTEAKKPTFELVPAEDSSFAYLRACPGGGFLIRLPSGLFRRRDSSLAYRRARPGGGVTKQLPSGPPESASSFSSAWKAEVNDETLSGGPPVAA